MELCKIIGSTDLKSYVLNTDRKQYGGMTMIQPVEKARGSISKGTF